MPLIEYQNAPISEVAFGLEFTPLDGFRAAHFGAFWNHLGDDFQTVEDQAPLLRAEEINTGRLILPRVWYVHRDKSMLVQLQSNRVWFNWRRLDDSSKYPRFPALMDKFQGVVAKLSELFRSMNVGLLQPVGFDLTYVNHVPLGELVPSYDQIGNVMQDVSWRRDGSKLPKPDSIGWSAVFMVDGIKLGVELKSAKQQSGEQRPIFVLELHASSGPSEFASGAELNYGWYERAHMVLLEAFEDLTTPKARNEHWHGTNASD